LEVLLQLGAVVAIVVETLAQVGDVRFGAASARQLVQQVPHMLVKVLLEFIHHVGVVVLADVALDDCSLLLASALALLARILVLVVIQERGLLNLLIVKGIVVLLGG